MAQEFTINSSAIENKINSLLPSQGGFGAGIDFSASTMVIPIVDLTETAEGAGVRADLQTALSLTAITAYSVSAATSTLINTTGYFRVFGNAQVTVAGTSGTFRLTDGTTTKELITFNTPLYDQYDFIVFLRAGESLTLATSASTAIVRGVTRQLASLDGTLVNP
tara:strand:- start:61 stop:555 length:495 start_codon:yes stop_codon:yes gene_type:complete